MTRMQQNEIIIEKLSDKLQDTPDVQKRLTYSFNKWFLEQLGNAPSKNNNQAGQQVEMPAAPAEG